MIVTAYYPPLLTKDLLSKVILNWLSPVNRFLCLTVLPHSVTHPPGVQLW